MSDTTRRHPRSLREIGPWPESCLGVEKPIEVGHRSLLWWLARLIMGMFR